MKKRKRDSSGFAVKDALIVALLVIIAVQGYWLLRRAKNKTEHRPRQTQLTSKRLGKIALIIDDSGYNIQDCDDLKSISYPVTISILPELTYSRDIAACARQYHKGVMLHLPLEPHQNADHYSKGYIITTVMSPQEVRKRFREEAASVPFIEGVNNHMGSAATEDPQLMALLFDQFKKAGLFFIDSRVTSKSICAPLAKRKGIPFAQRDVFLDNQKNREYIEGQFRELAKIARENGYAIGIGHARALTWQIIKEQTEKLSNEGFEIVPVAKLVQ